MKYYTDLTSSNGEKITLGWSDKANEGNVTPFPKEVTSTPPTEPPVEPPQPNMRNAFITTTAAPPYTPVPLIEGLSLAPNKYAIYVDGEPPVTLELFKDGVSFIPKRTENGKPLAVGGDDNGVLRLKDFPQGSYKLVMNAEVINFTVGAVTPPPTDPQPIKGISFELTPSGNVRFTFEGGITKYINLPPQ